MENSEYLVLNDSIRPEDIWWFYQVDGGRMQRVNLPAFYYLGKAMGQLRKLEFSGDNLRDCTLVFYASWGSLKGFLEATSEMSFPLSRTEAERLEKKVGGMVTEGILHGPTLEEMKKEVLDLELVFRRESARISAYSITPKGIYDTEKLIDEGEKKFPPDLLAVMPVMVVEDIQEASRCLAFERGTACAFHICRATEGLMRAYYKKLTGDNWPPPPPKPKMRKDWKVLVDQLKVEGAPKKIIERLGELREDRNSYAHPDVTVPVDEAPIVWETCTFAMFYIAKEMV